MLRFHTVVARVDANLLLPNGENRRRESEQRGKKKNLQDERVFLVPPFLSLFETNRPEKSFFQPLNFSETPQKINSSKSPNWPFSL